MRPRPTLVLLVCLVAASVARPASALAQFGKFRGRRAPGNITVGVRGGRDFENHAWSAGGQLSLPLVNRIELRPSGDYYFGDATPFRWQLNADGIFRFGPGGTVYGGGGAAFTRVRPIDKVKTGYNLFFGLEFARPTARSKPFAEFRWTFVNGTSPFRLVAGISTVVGKL
ncbi:MAG TPA: hypothetical protein VFW66_12190 [Gemmatimonadales bacterium]|nr:hypothetical protein [Gemmatimonadales bacterium]